jgi:hypothetical protein
MGKHVDGKKLRRRCHSRDFTARVDAAFFAKVNIVK